MSISAEQAKLLGWSALYRRDYKVCAANAVVGVAFGSSPIDPDDLNRRVAAERGVDPNAVVVGVEEKIY